MHSTIKLYYQNPFLAECEATVQDVAEDHIVCDRTVAFPEGGGQEGDRGVFLIGNNDSSMPFHDTRKGPGRTLHLTDFPEVEVGCPVKHLINATPPSGLRVGAKVRIKIDVARRASLSVGHTGLHLVIIGLEQWQPDFTKRICGCHIAPDHARVDFTTDIRLNRTDLDNVAALVNALVDADEKVEVYPHPSEPEALYWRCRAAVYPCGGTHLSSAGCLGHVSLQRKNVGRGIERVIARYPQALLPVSLYQYLGDPT